MPSLDDLKKRIKSVKSTQKITKAMKMVAAAKLRKAQENAEKGRPYSQKMQKKIMLQMCSIIIKTYRKCMKRRLALFREKSLGPKPVQWNKQ